MAGTADIVAGRHKLTYEKLCIVLNVLLTQY